jgi:hypothetical protein
LRSKPQYYEEGCIGMTGQLVEVDGRDIAGTTEYIFYDNGGAYTLLGSTNNTTAAVAASTSTLLAEYADAVYLPEGDLPANIVVFNQAGTVQTLGTDPTIDGDYRVTPISPVGDAGATGAAGAVRAGPQGPSRAQ